jgi:hypothetical protein
MRDCFIGGFIVEEGGDVEVKDESGRCTRGNGKEQAL